MDWLWEYVVWGLGQITPQGVLVGLIAGAVLTWIARGEWDGIGEVEDDA